MKYIFKTSYLFGIIFLLLSCNEEKDISSTNPVNWSKRYVEEIDTSYNEEGATYLSVYSQIYSQTEHRTHNLTATVSLRNVNVNDSVIITNASYYDTHGVLIRSYFEKPIYIAPMETVEIIIDERDLAGGTGANFVFNWKKQGTTTKPYFEAIMISTSGQQGLSFATQGIDIK